MSLEITRIDILYMRPDGNGSLEQTSRDDPEAIAYIKSDCILEADIYKKEDFYIRGDIEEEDYKEPCRDCLHAKSDGETFPCCACIHLDI